MTYDPEGAIDVLKEGLKQGKVGNFQQADALVRDIILLYPCDEQF